MANIYRYAALTIVAASASSSDQGFLQKREPVAYRPDTLKPYDSGGPTFVPFTLPFRFRTQFGNAAGRVEVYRNNEQSCYQLPEPVSWRGWTLQEAILSPRCLIFATSQVFWKCSTSFWKDGGFMDWETFKKYSGCWVNVGLAYTSSGLASFGGGDFVTVENALLPTRTEIARRWSSVARTYSTRQITAFEDKLPAISSIAAIYQNVLKEDYLAGLWRSTLLSDLLWRCDHPERTRPKRICPTWSWLSVDCVIEFRYGHLPAADWQMLSKVLSCTVTPLFDFAPFGQLKNGSSLEISGPAFTMTLEYGRLKFSESSASSGTNKSSNWASPPRISYFPDVDTGDRIGTKVRCLPISRTTWQKWVMVGLVLAPVGFERGAYERIGYFEVGPGSEQHWSSGRAREKSADLGWVLNEDMQTFTVF
jgi:hypothetical protein